MKNHELQGEQQVTTEMTPRQRLAVLGGFSALVLGGHILYQSATGWKQFESRPLPKAPVEEVNNKCEGNIMTIGDLKLRMPNTDLSQQIVYSKDQTPPQK